LLKLDAIYRFSEYICQFAYSSGFWHNKEIDHRKNTEKNGNSYQISNFIYRYIFFKFWLVSEVHIRIHTYSEQSTLIQKVAKQSYFPCVTVLTTPEVSSNDKTKTTTDSTTTTPAGHRNKRNAAAKRRHRRNHDTSTTPVPKTTVAAGTPLRVTGHVQEDKKEINTISLEPALEAGRTYVLDIKFKGLLKGSLYGFYRSSYKNKNGTRMYVLSHWNLFQCYVL
jgi:hypothetical protein